MKVFVGLTNYLVRRFDLPIPHIALHIASKLIGNMSGHLSIAALWSIPRFC